MQFELNYAECFVTRYPSLPQAIEEDALGSQSDKSYRGIHSFPPPAQAPERFKEPEKQVNQNS